jgi:hypothetical protein
MFLPEDTHMIHLRFKLDSDAPKEYIKRWLKLKSICESGENKEIVEDWLQNCQIESIKNMPYLNRCEGGIGGDDNLKNKQLRFRDKEPKYSWKIDNDIVFDNIISGENEKWTLDELDDLIRGFRRIANNYVESDCIKGCIEMIIKKSFNDNYLDNKEDY